MEGVGGSEREGVFKVVSGDSWGIRRKLEGVGVRELEGVRYME